MAAVMVHGHIFKPYPKESLLSTVAAVIHKNGTVQAMLLFEVLHIHVN
jgi:hypothetical protein